MILVLKNPDLGADFQVLVIWINLYPLLRELCFSTFDLENKQKYDFDAEKIRLWVLLGADFHVLLIWINLFFSYVDKASSFFILEDKDCVWKLAPENIIYT